eukprot:gnl/TRDRNA2_/TRDRNA2_37602_c0_seq2.p1 gnl/TRDRNA2_/TRDRNA2_37602_c0~~gnl/TRDRNA2_/TRDRNA2_37602_c0_seq2.p1  ORF type:complete len:496 (+),score=86.90 gnl/TRDRNA2_/TRDRNA2_37602_c0_seq2:77-1489(+)
MPGEEGRDADQAVELTTASARRRSPTAEQRKRKQSPPKIARVVSTPALRGSSRRGRKTSPGRGGRGSSPGPGSRPGTCSRPGTTSSRPGTVPPRQDVAVYATRSYWEEFLLKNQQRAQSAASGSRRPQSSAGKQLPPLAKVEKEEEKEKEGKKISRVMELEPMESVSTADTAALNTGDLDSFGASRRDSVTESEIGAEAGAGSRRPSIIQMYASPKEKKDTGPKRRIEIEAVGPDGQSTKFKIDRGCTVQELRKSVSVFVNEDPSTLELSYNKLPLDNTRLLPFAGFEIKTVQVIKWWRCDRLKAFCQNKKVPENLQNRTWYGRTLLHLTCISGDIDLMRNVMDLGGFDEELINVRDIYGDTALMLACILGWHDMVQLLLSNKAETDHQNIYGRTALLLASEHGHDQVVKELLTCGATYAVMPYPPRIAVGAKRPSCMGLAVLNERFKVEREIEIYKKGCQVDDIFGAMF